MIASYFPLISDDDLLPPSAREIYLRESERQGETPESARFRLRQWLDGLREQRAIQMRAAARARLSAVSAEVDAVPAGT